MLGTHIALHFFEGGIVRHGYLRVPAQPGDGLIEQRGGAGSGDPVFMNGHKGFSVFAFEGDELQLAAGFALHCVLGQREERIEPFAHVRPCGRIGHANHHYQVGLFDLCFRVNAHCDFAKKFFGGRPEIHAKVRLRHFATGGKFFILRLLHGLFDLGRIESI